MNATVFAIEARRRQGRTTMNRVLQLLVEIARSQDVFVKIYEVPNVVGRWEWGTTSRESVAGLLDMQ